jgi:hypothetical protein
MMEVPMNKPMAFGAVLMLFLPSCGNFVDYVPSKCERMTCAELGKQCGTWNDLCGEVKCGGCPAGETCRADGQCVETCDAATCQEMDLHCGTWNDGCGGRIECGACDIGKICDLGGRCVDDHTNQEDNISACGGFEANGGSLFTDPPEYCAAEVLHWLYEADTQVLKLADARMLLNCCGDHSMTMHMEGDEYVFTETDAPEGGWGRCACMCVFDFTIIVGGIPPGVIPFRIERVVTDWPEETGTVTTGQLDLSEGSGFIVVDETDVYPWCGEE